MLGCEKAKVLTMQTIRIALHQLRTHASFTLVVTLTLALTIGATASVFGMVYGVLLKSFPYYDPDRVLTIWGSNMERDLPRFTVSPMDYLDWQSQNHAFVQLAASLGTNFTVGEPGSVERVAGLLVTPSYFGVTGITLVLGRPLSLDSAAPEVVISQRYWLSRFGGSSSVLGQSLMVDGRPLTVVGVMPAGLPGDVDAWTRLSFPPDVLTHRDWHYIHAYGRLKPGVTPGAAQADLESVARRLAQVYPQTNKGWSVVTIPLLDGLLGAVRPALIMVLSAAACVLMLGLATLTNLLLARGLTRERDVAIRTALGATRGRIARELLLEASTVGLGAAALGMAFASVGVRALRALAPSDLPRLSGVTVGGPVIAFCIIVSFAAVMVFGTIPAWRWSDRSMSELLREGGQGTGTARRHRLQGGLLVLQVAVALVLLIGTGLFVKTLQGYWTTDPGFQPRDVLTAQIALPDRYTSGDRQDTFVARLAEELAAQPGVEAASISSALPGGADLRWAFTVAGEATTPGQEPVARPVFVSPDYFRTMGIALRRGRGVRTTDDRHAERVAVVDEVLSRRVFGGRDPVGRYLRFIEPDTDLVRIVGIVTHVRQGGLIAEDVPLLYLSIAQTPGPGLLSDVAMRVSDNPNAHIAMLGRTIAGMDAEIPVYDVRTLSARVAQAIGTTRFAALLSLLFTVAALAIGVVGIYSVLSFLVTQRRREIGVRLALGASAARVVRDVMRRVFVLTGVGMALGTIGAWWLMQLFGQLFGRVSPHDPMVMVAAVAVVALAAAAAASVPALRAASVSPVEVLRSN
jgi:putative ABC transport system permease protein